MALHCYKTIWIILAGLVCVSAYAADYPNKPIRLVIPFAPGGTNDILARMVQAHLSEVFGHPVVPDNRPGYQGILGTDLVVKAEPDGYTMGVISAAYTMNPATIKIPFDPETALNFVLRIGQSVNILVVGPKLPAVRSVADLVATAAKRPKEVVLSSSGGFQNFATSLFAALSKEKFTIVLYKGGFPALMDVIGGQVHGCFAVSTYGMTPIRAGKIHPLAVGSLERFKLMPELPTLDESGIKGYDASNWYALALPAKTPKPIVNKLYQTISGYFTSAAMQTKLASMGIVVDIKTSDEMRKIVPAEIAKWKQIAIDTGMPRFNK